MGYSVEQINIGDHVVFEDTPQKRNRDLFWQVVDKTESKLIIELKKYIWDESWTIDIQEVKAVLKRN